MKVDGPLVGFTYGAGGLEHVNADLSYGTGRIFHGEGKFGLGRNRQLCTVDEMSWIHGIAHL